MPNNYPDLKSMNDIPINIAVHGIVQNERGELLLIQRDDSRTWAAPGGSVEAGELPTLAVARELFEETGLKVMPVRLVSMYHMPLAGKEYFSFGFRCLVRGGELTPSAETPQVGFYRLDRVPGRIMDWHGDRLQRGSRHAGGPPYMGRQQLSLSTHLTIRWLAPLVYGWLDVKRVVRREPRYTPPKRWHIGAFGLIRDEAGQVLWVRRRDNGLWNLPGGKRNVGEAPWDTAVREAKEETGLTVRVKDLCGMFVKPWLPELLLLFSLEVVGGSLQTGPESAEFGYFAPGCEPADSLPRHVSRVATVQGFVNAGIGLPPIQVEEQTTA